MSATPKDVEVGARAIIVTNGWKRLLRSPGLYQMDIWERAKRQSRAVIEALEKEAGR